MRRNDLVERQWLNTLANCRASHVERQACFRQLPVQVVWPLTARMVGKDLAIVLGRSRRCNDSQ